MLDIKFIRKNPDLVRKAMRDRNADVDIDGILALDERHRRALSDWEEAKAKQNQASRTPIAQSDEREGLKSLKEKIKALEQEERRLAQELDDALSLLPNIPLEDTPIGKDAAANVVVREVGERPTLDFKAKSYVELGESLGVIDTETAGVVSGSRFGYLKGAAAMLEFALVHLTLGLLTDEGFIKKLAKKHKLNIKPKSFLPVVPPVMIRPEMMKAMGFLAKGDEEIYRLERDNLYLVGTSEQSMGPMHYNKVIPAQDLPLRYVGFSTCFRREAGSYGKDVKGIMRVHQFDKLEMFTVCDPATSRDEHLLLLAIEEALMQELELPYRVVRLSTGDIGAPSAGTYDIEAWLPGQNEYRETHSTSNTTDYQARRLKTKMKEKEGTQFVHMLNGTAFAIGRIIIAILENYQTKDGTVRVPKVLKKHTGLQEIK